MLRLDDRARVIARRLLEWIPRRRGRVLSRRGNGRETPAGCGADPCDSRRRRAGTLEAGNRPAPRDTHLAVGQRDRLRAHWTHGRGFDRRDDRAEHLPPALAGLPAPNAGRWPARATERPRFRSLLWAVLGSNQ